MWIPEAAILILCVTLTVIRTADANSELEFFRRQAPSNTPYSANGPLSTLILPLELSAGVAFQNLKLEPETRLSTIGLCRRLGYPAEAYTVRTYDGYLLELHRIPRGRKYNPQYDNKPRTPVLLQHGLLCSSAEWTNNFPNQSLAYILADNGYDVWLGNSRGNTYSRRHEWLNPEQKEFWEFSWDQMAEYDLPAVIDFILMETGFRQLHYIGHSQGTTIAFALLSNSPLYNSKIANFIALCPVTDMINNTSPISHLVTVQELGLKAIKTFFALAPIANLKNVDSSVGKAIGTVPQVLWLAFKALGINELLPNTNLVKFTGGTVCNSPSRVICNLCLDAVFGYNPAQLNETRWPVYLTHFPAGTSSQLLVHWAQIIHFKEFRRFDYGDAATNRAFYRQDTPPPYDLGRITTSVVLIYTEQDPLATPADTMRLHKKLRNVRPLIKLGDDNWVHMDAVWGPSSGKLIFEHIRKYLVPLSYGYVPPWQSNNIF